MSIAIIDCDEITTAERLVEGFAERGMNVIVTMGFGRFGANPKRGGKTETVYRVNVTCARNDMDGMRAEDYFHEAYKQMIEENQLPLSGEYTLCPADYCIAFPNTFWKGYGKEDPKEGDEAPQ